MANPKIDAFGNKHWLNEAGNYHREDGPALEYADGDKEWFLSGKRHRIDGPALQWANVYSIWYQHDKYHRTDGPAVVWDDGELEYWINGVKYHSLEEGLMDLALE